jgi:hypothetical protein
MKSSHRSLLALACLCMAAVATSAFRAVASPILSAYAVVKDFAIHFTLRGLDLVARAEPEGKGPAVVLVQAKAFLQRLVKRERPVISNTWRMCPST